MNKQLTNEWLSTVCFWDSPPKTSEDQTKAGRQKILQPKESKEDQTLDLLNNKTNTYG